MTTYEKELISIFQRNYAQNAMPEVANIIKKLVEMGVVDFTRCKVLVIREYVHDLIKQGQKKVDAMWLASEKFSCSYEYIRKCMYYYQDVNIC